MTDLRIAFAGTPQFAVPALRALTGSQYQVVGVLTQPDRPKGRGRHLTASPVKLEAQRQGLPCSQPVSLRSEPERSALRAWRPDLLVVVAYGLILPPEALAIPPLGCLNIHASLLPRWRGAAPIQRAILAGDSQTGITIMRMDAGLDTGPGLLQRAIPIGQRDTAGQVRDRLADLGADALLEALPLAADRANSTPQPEEGVTYAAKIEKSEACIDWRQDAELIDRQIRAFNPWPIADTLLDGEPLRIHTAAPQDAASDGDPPGTITALSADGPVVACGRGRLALKEVQRPGRRKVSGREFAGGVALLGRRLG